MKGLSGLDMVSATYRPCGSDGTRNFLEQYEEKERKESLARREREDAYVRLARYTVEKL